MKKREELECFYVCMKTFFLDDIPKDNIECSAFVDSMRDRIISALEKGKIIRAIVLSEGLLVGCAKISSPQFQTENTNTQEGTANISLILTYERIVLSPIERILELRDGELTNEKLMKEESVCSAPPVHLAEHFWEIAQCDGHEALSLIHFARYGVYITSAETTQAGNHCTSGHLTSARDISLALHCGRLPIHWGSIQGHLFELLDIPDSRILFRRFFAQDISVADLISLVEAILAQFNTFTNSPIVLEVFQCVLQKLSLFPLLLKELYLVVETKLVSLLNTEAGVSIILMMADSLPDVGKISLARSIAQALQNPNASFAVRFIKQARAKHEQFGNALTDAIESHC